jgi:hypothetical protein
MGVWLVHGQFELGDSNASTAQAFFKSMLVSSSTPIYRHIEQSTLLT